MSVRRIPTAALSAAILTAVALFAFAAAWAQDLLRRTAGLAYGELTQNAPVKEALGKAGIYKTTIDFDSRDLPPTEQVERMSKVQGY
jgi:hypothetical protein